VLAGILTVAVIAIGLPLLAFWVGARPFWSRLRPGREPDLWGDWMRRHRLSGREAEQVASAVARGQQVADQRLRAAAADLASITLDREAWPRRPVVRGTVTVLLGLLVGGLLVSVAAAIVQGRPGDISWWNLMIWAFVGVWLVRRRRLLRRAIDLNSDSAEAAGGQV
jgi:hypothetical protein